MAAATCSPAWSRAAMSTPSAPADAVTGRVRQLGTKVLCWEVPHPGGDPIVGGLVEGTVLASYAYTQYKSAADDDDGGVETLIVSAHHDVATPAVEAALVA